MTLSASIFLAGLILSILYIAQRRFTISVSPLPPHCGIIKKYRPKDVFFAIDFQIACVNKLPFTVQHHKDLGTTFQTQAIFAKPEVWTIAPENIQAIYNSGKGFGIQSHRLPVMGYFCGEGFLTTDGSVWQHSRKVLKPTFSKTNISDMSFLSREVEALLSEIPVDGSTFDLQDRLFTTFLHVSLRFLLGVDASAEATGAPCTASEFVDFFHGAVMGMGVRFMLGNLKTLAPKKSYHESCRRAHEYLDFYINHALENNKNNNTAVSNSKHGSMIQGLAAQTDDKEYIRSQVIQGMMASQDTTAVLVSNAVFLMSKNPRVWQGLRSEVLKRGEGLFTFENLSKFTTLQNILSETLRLCPVFSLMSRWSLQDTVLPVGGGPNQDQPIFIPKGISVATSFFALHRNEAVFGPDVEEFLPERWLTISPKQWECMAFGGGQRACLGREKVLAEAALVIARLAQEFERLESGDARPWTGIVRLTAKNANGCQISLFR